MKKLFLLSITLAIFIQTNDLQGFIYQRFAWWELEIKELHKKKYNLQKDCIIDKSIIGLIDKEIENAKEIICIFESNIKNDGSLNYERKNYSTSEIKKHLKNIVPALFPIYYLHYIVMNIGDNKSLTNSIDIVNDFLTLTIENHFKQRDDLFLKSIIKDAINSWDWKFLSMELFLGSSIISHDKCKTSAAKDIERRVLKDLSVKGAITLKELNELIITESIEILNSYNFNNTLCLSKDALLKSWCWERIYNKIKKNFLNYKTIISMTNQSIKNINLERVYSYYNNTPTLEKQIFNNLLPHYLDTRPFSNGKDHTDTNNDTLFTLNIPSNPNMLKLFSDIDTLRKHSLPVITGNEDKDFFLNLDKMFKEVIDNHMKDTINCFFREEERLRSTIEKKVTDIDEENMNIEMANEAEFLNAKKIFNKKLKLSYDYIKRSLTFLEWISCIKKVEAGEILQSYELRVNRNISYLDFIKSLVNNICSNTFYDNTDIQKKFISSFKKIKNLFKTISFSQSLEKRFIPHLSKRQLKQIKKMKSKFINHKGLIELDIKELFSSNQKKIKKINAMQRKRNENHRATIAEFEIELFRKKISRNIKLLKNLSFINKILTCYSTKFLKANDELINEKISSSTEKAIRLYSLFPLIKSFDKSRIIKERTTREYLINMTNKAIARLQTLLYLYSKNNIKIKNATISDEIRETKQKLKKKAEVTIAYWKMNESNFEQIDKKAIKTLIFIRNKLNWYKTSKFSNKNPIPPGKTIKLLGLNISLTIPKGWVNVKLDPITSSKGIVKSFDSLDKKSTIQIASFSMKGINAKDISNIWLKRKGCHPIKNKWGKINNMDFYWTLSCDSSKGIIETFAIERGAKALILSGKTMRDRYSIFKINLNSILNSIKKIHPVVVSKHQGEQAQR